MNIRREKNTMIRQIWLKMAATIMISAVALPAAQAEAELNILTTHTVLIPVVKEA